MCIDFPQNVEPHQGNVIITEDEQCYLATASSSNSCDGCDLYRTTKSCKYKEMCSCFYRDDLQSIIFKKIENFEEALSHLILKDAANNKVFSTGAVRDTADEKPRPDLASPFAEERIGVVLRDGAKRYGERNWEKGMPASRTIASLCRHLMQYKQGDRSEDHLAAVAINAMFLLDLEERVDKGLINPDLLDLPLYKQDNS